MFYINLYKTTMFSDLFFSHGYPFQLIEDYLLLQCLRWIPGGGNRADPPVSSPGVYPLLFISTSYLALYEFAVVSCLIVLHKGHWIREKGRD